MRRAIVKKGLSASGKTFDIKTTCGTQRGWVGGEKGKTLADQSDE